MSISKGVLYSLITMITSAAYMLIVFAADYSMKNIIGFQARWLELTSLFVLVLLFQPVMGRLQDMLDRRFFKTNIEAEKIREKFSSGIKQRAKIEDLAEYINRVAYRTFKLSGSAIYIFDEENGKYICKDARGSLEGLSKGTMDKDDALIKECIKGEIIIRKNKKINSQKIRDEMKKLNAYLCVPSLSKKKNKLVGFLLADEKSSQDSFNNEEIFLLETMANQAVMSVENAILYQGRIEAAKRRLLMKRLSDLGQAASNVAKQARMALAPIIEFSKQFNERWEDPDFIRKAAETLPFETEKLRLILMSVLIYSREANPAFEEIKLSGIFSWLSKLVAARARERNVAMEYKISDDLVIKMEKDSIKQVLLNLVLNAFDAMPYGGKITVSAETWEGKLYVKVKDTGEGIAKENLDKIFNPFFTTKQNAIGLGLTVVKKVVESYGGAIYVNGEPGMGAEFVIGISL